VIDMAIPPIPPAGVTPAGVSSARPVARPADPGFGDKIADSLQKVSNLEKQADVAATDIASGGSTGVHELMVATAQAQVGVDLLVQTRNKAVEAYQEIMRLQV
jgi:flagellar hook-basal body complex protein FliE